MVLKLVRIFNTASFLNNFELQKFIKRTLPNMKDEACLTNLNDYKSTGTSWIVLCVDGDRATYLESFGVKFIKRK